MEQSELVKKVEKIHDDMYFGDSRKPALTLRMEMVEDHMDKTDRLLNKLIWCVISSVVGILAEIVKSLVVH